MSPALCVCAIIKRKEEGTFMRNEEVSAQMLELLAKNTGMQEIVNQATNILGNPLVVVDTRFRILYASTNMELDIELWNQTMEEQYIQEEIIQDMVESEVIVKLKHTDRPVQLLLPTGYEGIRMPLFYRDRYCGFVGMYNYKKPITETSQDQLIIVSKALSALLYMDSSLISYEDNNYDSFLYQLLECDGTEKAELVCRKHRSLSFGGRKLLVCVSSKGDELERQNIPAGRIKDVLKQYLYHHYSTIHKDRLILLFVLDQMSESLVDHTMSAILEYCVRYHLTIGISFEFRQTEFIPYAYEQAIFAGEQCRIEEGKHLCSFESCLVNSILDRCLVKYPASYYEHSAFKQILEYDREFHTDYEKTLEVYLRHFCNLKEAADEMNVHYNTMKYRIQTIEKIIGRDLKNDSMLKIQLLFSALLYKREL